METRCIDVINELIQIESRLPLYWTTCRRLCKRCEVFLEPLRSLQQNHRFPVVDSARGYALHNLESLFINIRKFVRDFSDSSFIEMFTRASKRTIHDLHDETSDDIPMIGSLNKRFIECIIKFNMTIDYESKLREDLEDIYQFLHLFTQETLNIASQLSSVELSKAMDLLTERIKQYTTLIPQYVHTMGHRPLDSNELHQFELLGTELLQQIERKRAECTARLQAVDQLIDDHVQEPKIVLKIYHQVQLTPQEQIQRIGLVQKYRLQEVDVQCSAINIPLQGHFHDTFTLGKLLQYPLTNTTVMVKHVTIHVEQGQELLERLDNEVLVQKYVANPFHLLKCYGYLQDSQTSISKLVYEYAPYGQLHTLIENVQIFPIIPIQLQLAWLCDIAHGLQCLHEKSITHGQLSLTSLYLFDHLRLKVGDFQCCAKEPFVVNPIQKNNTVFTVNNEKGVEEIEEVENIGSDTALNNMQDITSTLHISIANAMIIRDPFQTIVYSTVMNGASTMASTAPATTGCAAANAFPNIISSSNLQSTVERDSITSETNAMVMSNAHTQDWMAFVWIVLQVFFRNSFPQQQHKQQQQYHPSQSLELIHRLKEELMQQLIQGYSNEQNRKQVEEVIETFHHMLLTCVGFDATNPLPYTSIVVVDIVERLLHAFGGDPRSYSPPLPALKTIEDALKQQRHDSILQQEVGHVEAIRLQYLDVSCSALLTPQQRQDMILHSMKSQQQGVRPLTQLTSGECVFLLKALGYNNAQIKRMNAMNQLTGALLAQVQSFEELQVLIGYQSVPLPSMQHIFNALVTYQFTGVSADFLSSAMILDLEKQSLLQGNNNGVGLNATSSHGPFLSAEDIAYYMEQLVVRLTPLPQQAIDVDEAQHNYRVLIKEAIQGMREIVAKQHNAVGLNKKLGALDTMSSLLKLIPIISPFLTSSDEQQNSLKDFYVSLLHLILLMIKYLCCCVDIDEQEPNEATDYLQSNMWMLEEGRGKELLLSLLTTCMEHGLIVKVICELLSYLLTERSTPSSSKDSVANKGNIDQQAYWNALFVAIQTHQSNGIIVKACCAVLSMLKVTKLPLVLSPPVMTVDKRNTLMVSPIRTSPFHTMRYEFVPPIMSTESIVTTPNRPSQGGSSPTELTFTTLLEILMLHKTKPKVIEYGLYALENLVLEYYHSNVQMNTSTNEANQLITLMQQHVKNEDIMIAALDVFISLTATNTLSNTPMTFRVHPITTIQNHNLLGTSTMCALLVRCFEYHKEIPEVINASLKFIINLSKVPEIVGIMFREHILNSLLKAFKRYTNKRDLLCLICTTWCSILSTNNNIHVGVVKYLGDKGIVKHCLKLLEHHASHHIVIVDELKVIRALLQHEPMVPETMHYFTETPDNIAKVLLLVLKTNLSHLAELNVLFDILIIILSVSPSCAVVFQNSLIQYEGCEILKSVLENLFQEKREKITSEKEYQAMSKVCEVIQLLCHESIPNQVTFGGDRNVCTLLTSLVLDEITLLQQKALTRNEQFSKQQYLQYVVIIKAIQTLHCFCIQTVPSFSSAADNMLDMSTSASASSGVVIVYHNFLDCGVTVAVMTILGHVLYLSDHGMHCSSFTLEREKTVLAAMHLLTSLLSRNEALFARFVEKECGHLLISLFLHYMTVFANDISPVIFSVDGKDCLESLLDKCIFALAYFMKPSMKSNKSNNGKEAFVTNPMLNEKLIEWLAYRMQSIGSSQQALQVINTICFLLTEALTSADDQTKQIIVITIVQVQGIEHLIKYMKLLIDQRHSTNDIWGCMATVSKVLIAILLLNGSMSSESVEKEEVTVYDEAAMEVFVRNEGFALIMHTLETVLQEWLMTISEHAQTTATRHSELCTSLCTVMQCCARLFPYILCLNNNNNNDESKRMKLQGLQLLVTLLSNTISNGDVCWCVLQAIEKLLSMKDSITAVQNTTNKVITEDYAMVLRNQGVLPVLQAVTKYWTTTNASKEFKQKHSRQHILTLSSSLYRQLQPVFGLYSWFYYLEDTVIMQQ